MPITFRKALSFLIFSLSLSFWPWVSRKQVCEFNGVA